MKSHFVRITAASALTLAAAGIGYYAGAQEQPRPAPVRTLKVNQVARIGERVISAEEFIQRMLEREKQYQDPDLRTAAMALDSLQVEELMALEAGRLGAAPKIREINDEYALLKKEWDEEFKLINAEIVKAQRANGSEEKPYSIEEWLLLRYNMTPKEFENQMRLRASRNLLTRMVVHYWMLSTNSAEAEGLMTRSLKDTQKLRDRLVKGERISDLAQEFSADIQTRNNYGKLGTVYVDDGTLQPEVAKAFWELKEDTWSEPIKTEVGYWLVRKTVAYLGNQAEFFNLREDCLKRGNPTELQVKKWRHATALSGRYAFERRMPGWDVQAGE